MRVDLSCGCGASITVVWDPSNVLHHKGMSENREANKQLSAFKTKHKSCMDRLWTPMGIAQAPSKEAMKND